MTTIIITIIISITILIIILLVVYTQKHQKEWDCNHNWETYAENEIRDDFEGTSHEVILICKKCGKIKKVKL